LEKGVAKAKAEVDSLSYEIIENATQYRGFIHAERRNLEQELALCHAEHERRKQARSHRGPGCPVRGVPQEGSVRGIRCVPLAKDPIAPAGDAEVMCQQVRMAQSMSEPSLIKGVLEKAL